MKVLIPCAGIGSRLGYFTKNFNKALIQVGLKPVISHIIDCYPKDTEFTLALGYKGEHIEEFLTLAYPEKKFNFVKIKNFEGPGSGLTHTLEKCSDFIKDKFIFHANDSLIVNNRFSKNLINDTLILSSNISDSMRYRTASINGKFIENIFDKKNYQLKNVYNYTGVSFIKDYKTFVDTIKKDNKGIGEVSYFLNQIENKKKISYKISNTWYDIGDANYYRKASEKFEKINIIPKNDQGIFFIKNKVFKFFTNSKIVQKRVKRSANLKKIVPEIISKKKYFYSYKFVKGKILSYSKNIDKDLKYLLNWSKEYLWHTQNLNNQSKKNFIKSCHEFYYEKTLSRIDLFYSNNNIVDEELKINNTLVPTLEKIINLIDWKDLSNGIPVKYHGDFHFENIIKIKKNKFCLIDFRESFGNLDNIGDQYYDLAKLKHGFELNHQIINDKLFNIKRDGNEIKFDIFVKENYLNCKNILDQFILDNNLSQKKVDIIKNLIFLNISALYTYPYSNFLYYMGKYKLYKSIIDIK